MLHKIHNPIEFPSSLAITSPFSSSLPPSPLATCHFPFLFCSPGWVDNFVWLGAVYPRVGTGRASIANFYHSLNFNAAFLSPLTAVSAGFTQPPSPSAPNIFPIRSCGQGLHCMANEIKLAAVALLMNTWQLQRSNAFSLSPKRLKISSN